MAHSVLAFQMLVAGCPEGHGGEGAGNSLVINGLSHYLSPNTEQQLPLGGVEEVGNHRALGRRTTSKHQTQTLLSSFAIMAVTHVPEERAS